MRGEVEVLTDVDMLIDAVGVGWLEVELREILWLKCTHWIDGLIYHSR
jgi:hypothetical protein